MVKTLPRSASILAFCLDRLDQWKVKQRIIIIIEVIKWVSVLDGWVSRLGRRCTTRQTTETDEEDNIKNGVFHAYFSIYSIFVNVYFGDDFFSWGGIISFQ